MLDNYELKNFKLQNFLNLSWKAENLKFSKMHQKKLSRLKYVREFLMNLCENYSFFPAYQGTLVTTVTCRYLALDFNVKFWNYASLKRVLTYFYAWMKLSKE